MATGVSGLGCRYEQIVQGCLAGLERVGGIVAAKINIQIIPLTEICRFSLNIINH